MPSPPGQGIFQLRITLNDVEPAVWRSRLLPAGVRLSKLHDIFQVAMGWTDTHLHSFTIDDERYGPVDDDDDPEDEIDETEVTVLDAIGEHRRFTYEYDFGERDILEPYEVPGSRAGRPRNWWLARQLVDLIRV